MPKKLQCSVFLGPKAVGKPKFAFELVAYLQQGFEHPIEKFSFLVVWMQIHNFYF